ncbi:hypothetical protein K435DRAFT_727380 [Dendrothele bispora CBS 962.96]|uniref:DUF7330 domain-containing protein n=1 Tax=Dendrothele bispora (strain CBS 962.96) TaxID=1314807 RepID=A0A4S8LPU4_DENBC|nr:hypothetical protein K435DRAFT_727380 [Dendrothele bispora CBS 962.96]
MIISNEDTITHKDQAFKTTDSTTVDAPPPDYASAIQTTQTQTPEPKKRAPSSSQADNYISIIQPVGPIECTYVLDPFLHVPQALLPPLSYGETEWMRKNLALNGKLGTINADITLHRSEGPQDGDAAVMEGRIQKKRINMEAQTSVGTINFKLRESPPSKKCLPFSLSCSAHIGSIVLFIPRSFRGFVDVHATIGQVNLTPGVAERARWIGSRLGKRRCFVGDFRALAESQNGIEENDSKWTGDEVDLQTWVGSIEIAYIDETVVGRSL